MDANQKLDMGILKGTGLASCDNDDPPSAVCAELFDLGLMGIEIPEKYGGTGSSFTGACIVVEELAKIDPAISVIVDIQNTLINKIFYTYASDELQSKYASLRSLWIDWPASPQHRCDCRYLPQLAQGTLASFCLSEQGSGSDAFAMRTKATKRGAKYVIDGHKMWISNAMEADLFLVFANAAPELGYKGITCFAVDRDMGVKVSSPSTSPSRFSALHTLSHTHSCPNPNRPRIQIRHALERAHAHRHERALGAKCLCAWLGWPLQSDTAVVSGDTGKLLSA